MEKIFLTLEFDKICDILSSYAAMDMTKERIKNISVSDNIKKVNILQNETEQAITLITKKGNPPVNCPGDIKKSLRRCNLGGTLSIGEILSIGKVLDTSHKLSLYCEDIECDALCEHFESLYKDNELKKRIFSSFIDEENISDDASSTLYDIRRLLNQGTNKVKEILHKIISGANAKKYLQEQIITMRFDRYVVPVKAEYKGEIKGILHDTSSSGATLFIEPSSVVEANNKIRELKSKEKEETERILKEFTEEIASVSKLIEITYDTISELDFCFARAKFSLNYDCYRPVLNDKGIIDIKKARHPLIDKDKVVPTDIRLGKDFDTLVVTGPNTGGKTVVLKTLGLFTLMAQSGLHIPAQEGADVAVFRNIFADIGDEQSIEQSLSTFSSHMVNIIDILSRADEFSLCLFDELGAGTDPAEGSSLAVSILEKVKQLGAKTAATTHYSEIKTYALSAQRVENASCEFDVESLRPTYRLLIGIPGKSNAFAISKRLGLDDEIIENAKRHMTSENIKFEDILSELEKNRAESQKLKESAKKSEEEAKKLKTDISFKNKLLTEKTDKIIERARMEAKEILDRANKEADSVLKEMRTLQLKNNKEKMISDMQKAKERISKEAQKNSQKLSKSLFSAKESYVSPKTLKIGENIELMKLHQEGFVITLPDQKGDFYARCGIMKIKTNIKDVRIKNENKENAKKRKSFDSSLAGLSKTMTLSSEIDVRGETVDSAVIIIDKFLDDAFLSGLSQVRIIHGKGTGQLKKGIHEYLKRLSFVKSFRLGTFGEGDTGVTVVELN